MKIKYWIGILILKLLSSDYAEKMVFRRFKKYALKNIRQPRAPEKPRLYWGPHPIINIKYFALAFSDTFFSKSVVDEYYEINNKTDFDIYINEQIYQAFKRWPVFLIQKFDYLFKTYYVLEHFDVFHIPFVGLYLRDTKFWKEEADLYARLNKKIVVLPYGSDAYMYSKVKDYCLQHAMLISYPDGGKFQKQIEEKVEYWSLHADIIMGGIILDGLPKWDLLPVNHLAIDTSAFEEKKDYSPSDGKNRPIRITHAPNHRGGKGTEFILHALETLKQEGFLIELNLLEKKKNSEVIEILKNRTDILVDQLIIGYGLNAIEGMACGTVVVSNIGYDPSYRIFRRYSYLNECPICTANPESIVDVLRFLIQNPAVREDIGKASSKYVRKYHSFDAARYTFGKIYDKIWFGKETDLINMFHPVNPASYNNQSEVISHPLFENKLPEFDQKLDKQL